MSPYGPGAKKERANPEASADTKAEAIAFPSKESALVTSLSLDEMAATAKKLRRHVITMIGKAGSGHAGGSLSAAEIVTALYFKVLRHDPTNPRWADRDRFILSKGHAAPILLQLLLKEAISLEKNLLL